MVLGFRVTIFAQEPEGYVTSRFGEGSPKRGLMLCSETIREQSGGIGREKAAPIGAGSKLSGYARPWMRTFAIEG